MKDDYFVLYDDAMKFSSFFFYFLLYLVCAYYPCTVVLLGVSPVLARAVSGFGVSSFPPDRFSWIAQFLQESSGGVIVVIASSLFQPTRFSEDVFSLTSSV